MPEVKRYKVWDRTTRIFHWINAVAVFSLLIVGTIILNAKTLGIEGDAKILLKTVHAYIGYVFVINLVWRLIWAFFGNYYARWKQILPVGENYSSSLKEYTSAMRSGKSQHYLGHNPIARLIVGLFFLLLSIQAITGLIITGTDLYLPPFGSYFAEWVTEGDPERLQVLKAGDKTHIVESAYKEMRGFRKPVITIHYYLYFVLLGLVIIHLGGVIVTELKERSGLISAMITGEKVMNGKPVDLTDEDENT